MPSVINCTTTNGIAVTGDNSGQLEIQTNSGTTAITVTTGQGVKVKNTIGVGDATPSTSGAGITFPATQSASTDANTLDDYEEGTWTPSLTFGGNSASMTYSGQLGNYTKIGNVVYVQFRINLSNKGSSTGTAALSGLPFTAGGTYSQTYIIHDNTAGFSAGFGMYWAVENGATSGNLRQIGTNGSSGLDQTNFNNNTLITGTLVYRV